MQLYHKMKLNGNDKALLELLNRNSRQADAELARTLRMSKQAIGYHIKKLIDESLITYFYTEFNVSMLGFSMYYVFLELEGLSNHDEQKIVEKLREDTRIGWLIQCMGRANIILLVYARTLHEFEIAYSDVRTACSRYLRDAHFAVLTQSRKLSYRFLGGTESSQNEQETVVAPDHDDYILMKAISQDARARLTDISRRTGTSIDILRYRLRKLQEQGIINGFRTKLNISLLGMQWYLLLLRLDAGAEKRELVRYLRHHKETYYLTSTLGSYDLLVDVHVQSVQDVHELISKLRDHFPGAVRMFDIVLVFKEHKLSYLPSIETNIRSRKHDNKPNSAILK